MRSSNIIDATLVKTAPWPTNRRKHRTTVDSDARWTARGRRDPTLSYELHATVDEDTGVVRRITLTPTLRRERTVAQVVASEDEGQLRANAAYNARKLRKALAARSVVLVIAHTHAVTLAAAT